MGRLWSQTPPGSLLRCPTKPIGNAEITGVETELQVGEIVDTSSVCLDRRRCLKPSHETVGCHDFDSSYRAYRGGVIAYSGTTRWLHLVCLPAGLSNTPNARLSS